MSGCWLGEYAEIRADCEFVNDYKCDFPGKIEFFKLFEEEIHISNLYFHVNPSLLQG